MSKKLLSRKGDSISAYFKAIDFAEWWDEFALAVLKNGSPKFKTIFQFVKTKAKSQKQKEFLWWILGPKVKENGQHPYSAYDQWDWEEKRDKGFWFSSQNIENLRAEVKRKHSSMEAIRTMGQINIDFIGQLIEVSNQLDREYLGQLTLPNLTAAQNEARINLYLSTKKQIQQMLNEAQLMYSKTQGVDVQRLESFLNVFGTRMADTLAGVSSDSEQGSRPSMLRTAEQFTKMLAGKAENYDLSIPAKVEEELKEINARPASNGKANGKRPN
jgi:hypothetical protein